MKAKVHSSTTGEWQASSSSVFLGYQYHWAFDEEDQAHEFSRHCPCVFDSANGLKAVDGALVEGASVKEPCTRGKSSLCAAPGLAGGFAGGQFAGG